MLVSCVLTWDDKVTSQVKEPTAAVPPETGNNSNFDGSFSINFIGVINS